MANIDQHFGFTVWCLCHLKHVLRQLGESQLEWLALTPTLQLAPQENVVVLANNHSSVVASGAETFSTLFVSLAIWCSLGQEAAVYLITGAVI